MRAYGTFDLIWLGIMFCLMAWWVASESRYLLRRFFSRRWPTAEAMVQRGARGRISTGKGSSVAASFLGYTFVINQERHAGIFALPGPEESLKAVEDDLLGKTINVRYKPTDRNVSFVVDLYDSRFRGLRATQDPEFLSQAPEFHLKDAMQV
jgi:hypothetical protein